MSAVFYSYSVDCDDEIYDAEFKSYYEALASAQEDFEEQQAQEDDQRDGNKVEKEIDVIGFTYNDDGEKVIRLRKRETLEYDHYHGDRAEHSTIGR